MLKDSKLSNTFWKSQIEKLEGYCKNKGWTVEYKKREPRGDTAHPETGLITIQEDRKPEITFYYFLHEIGHLLLCQNNKAYEEKYDDIFSDFSLNSQIHKITRLEEEIEAWKAGYKLGKRLDLFINKRKFTEIKSRCLTTYIMWTVKRKVDKELDEALGEQAQELKNEYRRKLKRAQKATAKQKKQSSKRRTR